VRIGGTTLDRLDAASLSVPESDLDGKEVKPPRRIYDRRSLQVRIISHDVPRTTREGRRLRRLARLAKGYEAAKCAAEREAGYWASQDAASDAARRITDLTRRLLKTEPVTLAGARVIAECESASNRDPTLSPGVIHRALILLE
jgi:hypothetical protein